MTALSAPARRWRAPEVVQTSAMDCGPATLKCVLEGHGIRVSYGRLREACQTDVDGTSIDTLEVVAGQLGVRAEQVLIPTDHVLLPAAAALPAILVVRLADGAAHFIVLWRRLGPWLQVMDPATGRRWVHQRTLLAQVHRHEHGVAAADWRAWADSTEFTGPLRQRLTRLGAEPAFSEPLLQRALADAGWFGCAALDAALRMAQSVVTAGGLPAGAGAARLARALFERCLAQPDDIFSVVPAAWWSVTPDPASTPETSMLLRLHGAVLLRLLGTPPAVDAPSLGPAGAGGAAPADARADAQAAALGLPALSAELQAALREQPERPLAAAWRMLREGGLLAPAALAAAMLVAAGGIVVETLLLRGLFDLTTVLAVPLQRVLALMALLGFAALLLAIEVPIVRESLRHGRHLEMRLRMALLTKLPRLGDRYFQSRSVSDMADRSHSIQLVRQMPTVGLNLVQTAAELAFTLLGLALIAPACLPWALAIAAAAVLLPLAWQQMLGERDLRVRNQAAALHGFYLDALLGAVPLRTHRAGPAVRRQHEALLVDWARSSRSLIATALAAEGVQSLLCVALAGGMLIDHFLRQGAVGGSDLLLVYWALKLPALGGSVAGLLRQLPAQRNVMQRQLEPLAAPEALAPEGAATPLAHTERGVALQITQGRVLAAGHEILRDLDLQIAAGEHVAVVGASGAGKSSLLGLLLGWHRLADGTLSADGHAMTPLLQDSLRRCTAWVDPGVQLWNRSLLDNLQYASGDGALARIGDVITAADLRGVLGKLPQGLQTTLGEGGALLSGGEGQRVRLGRALLQTGVRLALLDEPFRGLDRAQRAQLLQQARQWWGQATLLCVTHDLGETLTFDRVLVVEDGQIIEDGAPHQLAAGPTRYAELLAADADVRQHLWQGPSWRHLRVQGGRLQTPGPQP